MTLQEANDAAKKGFPVIYNGIEYRRITQVGRLYSETKGWGCGFVQLLDKNSNSVVQADPAHCTLKE